MTSRFARARPFFSGRYYTRSNETPSTSPKSSTGAKPDDGVDPGIMNSDVISSNRSAGARSEATPRRRGGKSKTASAAVFSSEASEEPVRSISGRAQDGIFSSLMDSEDPHQFMQSGAARLLQTQSEDRPASKQRSRTAAPERPGTTPKTSRPAPASKERETLRTAIACHVFRLG
eukprot:s1467_g5.t1